MWGKSWGKFQCRKNACRRLLPHTRGENVSSFLPQNPLGSKKCILSHAHIHKTADRWIINCFQIQVPKGICPNNSSVSPKLLIESKLSCACISYWSLLNAIFEFIAHLDWSDCLLFMPASIKDCRKWKRIYATVSDLALISFNGFLFFKINDLDNVTIQQLRNT